MSASADEVRALAGQVAELAAEVGRLKRQLVLKTAFEELCDRNPDYARAAARSARRGRRPSYLRLISGGTG